MIDLAQADPTLRSSPQGLDDGVFTRHRERVQAMTTITVTRKLCFNRGNLRLWIEGKFLVDAGFNQGDRYDLIDLQSGRFVISKTENGARKIAGKEPNRPIVDICSTKLLDKLGAAGDLLTIISTEQGRITIQRSEA